MYYNRMNFSKKVATVFSSYENNITLYGPPFRYYHISERRFAVVLSDGTSFGSLSNCEWKELQEDIKKILTKGVEFYRRNEIIPYARITLFSKNDVFNFYMKYGDKIVMSYSDIIQEYKKIKQEI